MKIKIKIWTNNYPESLELIRKLKKNFQVKHILSASTLPVVDFEGEMIIGYGNILKSFKL